LIESVGHLVGDVWAWLLSNPFGREKLALLVTCMVGMYILSAQLAWRMGFGSVERALEGLNGRSWFVGWLSQVLRLLYYVGVPLLVLWRSAHYSDLYREMGIATTYAGNWTSSWPLLLTGLGEAEQILNLGVGAAIGSATLLVLLIIGIWYKRVVLDRVQSQEDAVVAPVPGWVALREALYLQLLWALYRGFAATLTADRLQAASIGLALVAVCWISDPRRRYDLVSSRGYLAVQDWLFALFTAFLSLTVRALWFLVVMHVLWIWFSGQVLSHLSRSSALQAISRSNPS
jgi:hypothetical protein